MNIGRGRALRSRRVRRYVPELPGIGVAGEIEAEVRALVTDAISLYLDKLGLGENQSNQSTSPVPGPRDVIGTCARYVFRHGHEGVPDG